MPTKSALVQARTVSAFEIEPETPNLLNVITNKSAELMTGFTFNTRVLNYIWDHKYPVGTVHQSQSSEVVKHMVVMTGQDNVGDWVIMDRNVYEDFKKAFGVYPKKVMAVGLMTDTDATQDSVTAYYGDIAFRKNQDDLHSSGIFL